MADRIVVLADGRIAADGPAATALTPELLQRVYGIRTQVTVTADRVRIDILGRQDPQP